MVRLGVDVDLTKLVSIGFQFQHGTIGSRSTTRKNRFILNRLTFVNLTFLVEKIVDHLKRIFAIGSTILYVTHLQYVKDR